MATLPNTLITFAREQAKTFTKRGDKGTVLITCVEVDVKNHGYFSLKNEEDLEIVPKTVSKDNLEYIKKSFIGSVTKPKEVIVIIAATLKDCLNIAEAKKFNYIVGPHNAVEADTTLVETFTKEMRDAKNIKIKAILPNKASDHEGIINFTTDNIVVGQTTYKTAQYCSRIAGLIAGTPLQESATFKVLPEITDVPKFNRADLDKKVDNGEFIIFHDGTKVKVGRGVTSLKTVTAPKNEDMKYIKIVDSMDLIYGDLREMIDDNYIGRYTNNYLNKLKLLEAISAYFAILERDQIIDKGWEIGIDVEANRKYLISKGKDVDTMKDQEIKEATTGANVFLRGKLVLLNSIEDIEIDLFV